MPEDQARVTNMLTVLFALLVPSWLGWRGGFLEASAAAALYWAFGMIVYEIRSFDVDSSGFARTFHLWVGWCPPLVIGLIAAAIRRRRQHR